MAELTKDAKTQEAELKVKQADADAAMEVRDHQTLRSPCWALLSRPASQVAPLEGAKDARLQQVKLNAYH